jgi:drug/metabolite transporter (DMT)-like permease
VDAAKNGKPLTAEVPGGDLMTNENQTSTTMTFGQNFGTYVILAIVVFLIALVSYFLNHPAITEQAVVAGIMVAIAAAIAQYASTGNIPGTPVSVYTVLIAVVAAGLVVLEWFANQSQLNEVTILTGIVLFLESFIHEIQPATPTATARADR